MPSSESLFDEPSEQGIQALLDQIHHGFELSLRVTRPAIKGGLLAGPPEEWDDRQMRLPKLVDPVFRLHFRAPVGEERVTLRQNEMPPQKLLAIPTAEHEIVRPKVVREEAAEAFQRAGGDRKGLIFPFRRNEKAAGDVRI